MHGISESRAHNKGSTLKRSTLRTSRLLDFATEKALVTQTGHQRGDWPLVVLKELVDNAIDACEEAGIAPVVSVKVDGTGISVEDNGPGIPADTIEGVLDFSIRMSSREAYVSPTRGAQGNALKTIVAMPFVIDGKRGRIEIETGESRHLIEMTVDHIRQEPVIAHRIEPINGRIGTLVRVDWPDSACSKEGETKWRFLQIASDYGWLNPHLQIDADWHGETLRLEPTNTAWKKWLPSEPTSPHWYSLERIERLIGGYVSNGRDITVREFISEFRGLSGTAKQKAVLNATGLHRDPLTRLVNGHSFDHEIAAKLLAAMQQHSKPVKPDMLGIIGREHFATHFAALGGKMESFDYRKVTDIDDGIPEIVETAFCWCPSIGSRRIVTGVNWSPGIVNPFRQLGQFGRSLDTILSRQRMDQDEPVIFVLHAACARVEYTDHGKSSVVTK